MTSEGDLAKKPEIKMEMLGTNKKWYLEGFTQKQNERTGKDSHTNWKQIRWTSRIKAKCSRADVGQRKIRIRSKSVGIYKREQIWKIWAGQRRIRSSNCKSKTRRSREK